VVITIIETSHLQPLFTLQLIVDGSNYLLWTRTAKVHIFAKQLLNSIIFGKNFIINVFIFIIFISLF